MLSASHRTENLDETLGLNVTQVGSRESAGSSHESVAESMIAMQASHGGGQ
jgi:hypothetical protein